MGFASVGVGIGNGGSSSSFSNLSPLAPPFTLDRSVTKPIASPLVDMTEPSYGVGVPLNSSLHNWLPSSSQTSGLDFFSNPSSEFDWLPFSSGSRYPRSQGVEPSDNHGPLLGRFTMSSADSSLYGDSSTNGLTTGVGKAKPYYPSYAKGSGNKGCPMVIVDQPSYDWISNSHDPTLDVPSCTNYSRGSSSSERSVEEASHAIDMLDLNKCSEFLREYSKEELLLEPSLNIEPDENSRITNMDAHSAFPGCHPKNRTPPLNQATSSQNCQFQKNASYREILREQDARLSETTSTVNSPATFSIRPPVVSTDSFVWNMGPCNISDYGYDSVGAKQGGNDLPNVREFLPFNSDFGTENLGTCIDKNDRVITESLSTKIHDLPNNICAAVKDSPNRMLKAGMGLHIPVASPHFGLDLKTIETATGIESSSESFDQYNVASVDSPCWKGALGSQVSPFQAYEFVTPSRVKKVEAGNSVNLSLPQVFPCTAVDTVEVFARVPNVSTIGSSLEKGATSSPNMPSFAVSLPAEQKTSDSVKAGDFYSKMGCLHPASNSIHEPVEDGGDSDSSCSMPLNNYRHNFMFGKRIAPTSCIEKHADARFYSGNSSEYGLNNMSCDAAEHVHTLPFELAKAYLGEPIEKIDAEVLVDTLQSLSELLLTYCCSNGVVALGQREVKSLETVMNNIDVCINNLEPHGSLSPEQRTPQNLGQFHQLHSSSHFQDVGVPMSQMTKIEGANLDLECPSNDWNGVEAKNEYILSNKGKGAADDSKKEEDSMTQALKKVLSENFHDEEGEHPQTLLYKNLWLEAEAALCASNCRARFNRAKLEMEKGKRVNTKNQDEQPVSDVSPNASTNALKIKVGSISFVPIQTSHAMSVSSHADDVIARPLSVIPDMGEKSVFKQNAAPAMDSPFPTSEIKVMDKDKHQSVCGHPTSPTLARSSNIDFDNVMSRFQMLKCRDERAVKVQKLSSSSNYGTPISRSETSTIHSPGIAVKHHPIADNIKGVNNLDGSVMARLDILRSRGQQFEEVAAYSDPASKREHWPMFENKVKGGGGLVVETEPFLRFEPGGATGKESRRHAADVGDEVDAEGKLPAAAGCFDGSSSDWEHVLWSE